jgi:acyl-homoserine-lactone acylase
MRDHWNIVFLGLSIFVALVSGCKEPAESEDPVASGADPYAVAVGPYDVEVRWTSFGIPHVIADDYGSLGFGSGYAFAQDHLCTFADQIVMVRSERSKYFGEDYLDQDFALKALRMVRYAEEGFLSLDRELRDTIVGYAAGYNQYLADTSSSALPEACRDVSWVKPISHIDLLA